MSEKKTRQILENLGEFIQEEQTENQETYHVFSGDYMRKKEALLHSVESKRRFRMSRPAVAAASILVVAACSVSVYAAVKILNTKVNFNKEKNHVAIENEISDAGYIPPIEITPGYLPKGYEEWDDGKYSYQGEYGGTGLSIVDASGTKSEVYQDISDCDEKKLSNARAYIFTRNGYEYSHIVLLSFEEEGHTVAVYASDEIGEEELLKVCENITIRETPEKDPDKAYQAFAYEPEEEYLEDELTITKDQIAGLHETFTETAAFTEDYEPVEVQTAITDVVVSDRVNLSLLNENTVFDIDENLPLLNSDGTFPDYTVSVSYWDDESDGLKQEDIGTYPVRYVEVTAELANLSDRDATDVNVQPRFCNLEKREDGKYDLQYMEEQKISGFGDTLRSCSSYGLSTDNIAFYFDSSAYPGDSHFYNTSLKAGETKTVHFGFAVPEHWMENLYLGYHIGEDGSKYVKLDLPQE